MSPAVESPTRPKQFDPYKYKDKFKSLDKVVNLIRMRVDGQKKRPWIPSGPLQVNDGVNANRSNAFIVDI